MAKENQTISENSFKVFKPTMDLLPIVVGPCVGAIVSTSTESCKRWELVFLVVFTIVVHFIFAVWISVYSKDVIKAEMNGGEEKTTDRDGKSSSPILDKAWKKKEAINMSQNQRSEGTSSPESSSKGDVIGAGTGKTTPDEPRQGGLTKIDKGEPSSPQQREGGAE